MAQPQRQADVHQDELCPPNKRYALMDANKKIDLDNPLCPNESKIIENILQNHPLRFSIVASSSVPWIYLGLHYSLEHPSTPISYPRFTKLIVSHYMTAFSEISRRVHDKYNNLEDDEMLTEHYRMYDAVFGVDVPMTQSQPIESTHGTHRTTSAPRSPNPDVDEGESSDPRKFTIIRLGIPPRRSTRLTSPTPIPTTEIEKLMEGTKNVGADEVDSFTLRQNDLGTRQQNQDDVGKMIVEAIQQDRENLWVEITSQINNAITNHIPSQDDPHDDAHPKGENSAKRQKTYEHGTYVFGESSSGQINESEPDDDELPIEKVSQEHVMSQTIDEAKLCKVVNEMLRQRCTSGDEHQYHID
nr:hypothetical protein [Tanacetum cinerariifolium]